MTDKFNDKNAFLIIIIFSFLQSVYNIMLPLHPDEAYYWLWSMRPALSYYDHPPMIAYVIRLFSIFGDSVFAVRLAAVFCMGIGSVYIYLLAKDVYGRETAWTALLLSFTLPATNLGYTITTPDAPLILFWASSLYYCNRALKNGSWAVYTAAGVSLGGLLLSKYTSVLFLGFLFLFLVVRRPKLFLGAKPWAAVIIAFIIFSPVIYWNYLNDWISFSFQYIHGTGKKGIKLSAFFDFVGGLFLVFTPVYMVILIRRIADFRSWFRNDEKLFVALSCLFPLLFFMYKSLFKRMELNWAAIGFISGIVILAEAVRVYKLKKSIWAGVAVALFFSIFLKFSNLLPLPPKLNIQSRVFGYEQAVKRFSEYIREGDDLFGGHLRVASMQTFYLKGHPEVSIPIEERFSQFNLWDKDKDFSKMHGVFLSEGNEDEKLKKVFSEVTLLEVYTAQEKGYKPRTFHIYRVKG
jgi:4-amino-4-deoxy-L-arabinose transferase-like glycosyltransferase